MDVTFNCDNCGQNLTVDSSGSGASVDCPTCNAPLVVPAAAPPIVRAVSKPPVHKTEEKAFFTEKNVSITNARAIFGAKTYAMANITSVMHVKISPSKFGPIVLMTFGAIVTMISVLALIVDTDDWPVLLFGMFLFVAGLVAYKSPKDRFVVRISTAGGEVYALVDLNQLRIVRIVQALNEAIIHRG